MYEYRFLHMWLCSITKQIMAIWFNQTKISDETYLKIIIDAGKAGLTRLNNTESFLYTVSCSVDIVACFIVIGKGIPPNKHAIFCLLSLFLL